jgi:2-oxoglutarate ferredoxin oxidoreductase subunit alpha
MIASNSSRLFLRSGNQMIAEGALEAGCRFFAGYPITPASGIYKGMIDSLPSRGGVALSAPDEISALAYCVGASMRGFKAMTATSGPGWALMIETVQYALMTEIPVVIALVQRLGPSTGGATQGGQGDILLSEFCTSGGYTIPVFCPSTPLECFELTMRAFNWSEILRTPVIVLTDKEVGMTTEKIDYARLHRVQVIDRLGTEKTDGNVGGITTYGFDELYDIPLFEAVGSASKQTVTGSAHNKKGDLKKNDAETLEVLYHLEAKIEHRKNDLALVAYDPQEEAETLVLSYGITSRAMREAVMRARRNGKKVASMNIMSLFPLPVSHLEHAVRTVKRVVVAEENLNGQYRRLITPYMNHVDVIGINKIGSMITPEEIEAKIG